MPTGRSRSRSAADKGFDTQRLRHRTARDKRSPRMSRRTPSGRRSAIDGRTTRHPGYAVTQRIRKRIEEAFGWAKTVAGLRKTRHRGLPKVDWQFTLAMAAYNLVRLPKLLIEPAAMTFVLALPNGRLPPPPPTPCGRLLSTAPLAATARAYMPHYQLFFSSLLESAAVPVWDKFREE